MRLFESAVVDRNQTKLKLGILNQQSRTNITAGGECAITAWIRRRLVGGQPRNTKSYRGNKKKTGKVGKETRRGLKKHDVYAMRVFG